MLLDRKTTIQKRSSTTDCTQEPPTKIIRKCLSSGGSDEDSDADIGPTCLICYSSISHVTITWPITFTPCCTQKVHKKCWEDDGCPKCNDDEGSTPSID